MESTHIIRYGLIAFALFGLVLAFIALVFWVVVTQPFYSQSGIQPSLVVDPARLEAHVRLLSSPPFHLRNAANPATLGNAGAYIRDEFAKTRGKISEQVFAVDGSNYKNIIVSFAAATSNTTDNPDDSPSKTAREERIIVGAHYDAADGTPGADDNASGIAGLIELARLLDEKPLSLPVDLVAYTLEEPPYFRTENMGSARHVAMLREQNIPVRAMLALEMIGYFSDAPDSQAYPFSTVLRWFYPSEGNFIAIAGTLNDMALVRTIKGAMKNATTLPVHSINAPRFVPGLDFSDHLNYWNEGYPAVMITDTAFYRNRNYHQNEDTAEKLNYPKMAMVVQGVYAAITAISNRQ